MAQFPFPDDCSIATYKELREKRIKAVVELAGVDYSKYHSEYLRISEASINKSGCGPVLQRDIGEIWTNAYNKDWLRAWDGNMDLQVCLDFFAVITYILEYAFKPEPEESALRKLIEQDKDGDFKNRMKALAHLFQTRRQMGEAEAAYKIIPSLTMTNSNITCQWIDTDSSSDRHTRMKRAAPDSDLPTVELEGREGRWYKQYTMRDKYARRPDELHHMCLAQWAKMYTAGGSKSEDSDEDAEDEGREEPTIKETHPLKTVVGCNNDCCEESQDPTEKRKIVKLPQCFAVKDPYPGEAKCMKLRNVPAALRFYKGDTTIARNLRREFILYLPWGLPGQPNFPNMSDSQIENHNHNIEHIKRVKGIIMPHLEDVAKQQDFVDEFNLRKVGDELAAGKEQENEVEEQEDEGDLDFLDPDKAGLEDPEEVHKGKPSIYSKIEVRNLFSILLSLLNFIPGS